MTRSPVISIKVINDSLIWWNDVQQAWADITNFLSTVGSKGVILSDKKFQFTTRNAEFTRFQLGNGTIKPLEKYIEAIRDLPKPKNLTHIISFFSLCEQVSYAYTIKEELKLFHELVKTKKKSFTGMNILVNSLKTIEIALLTILMKQGVQRMQ